MYCPSCGAQLPDGSKFCKFCGAKQASIAPPEAEAQQPVPEAYQPAPEAYQPAPETYQPAPEAYQPAPETYQPAPEAYQPAPEQTWPQTAVVNPPMGPGPDAAPKKSGGKKIWPILVIVLGVVCVALAAVSVLLFMRGRSQAAELAGSRAEVEALTGEAAQRDQKINSLESQVSALQSEKSELQTQVNDLNAALEEQNALLEGNGDSIQELMDEIDYLSEQVSSMWDEIDFYEMYAGIVNEEYGYYHVYGCEDADLSSFWIYNIAVAENEKGCTPCPKCH